MQDNWDKATVKIEVSLAPELQSINKSVIEKVLLNKGAFNVSNISETKKSAPIKNISNKLNTKMDVSSAIKKYAETYIDNKIRSSFIELAMNIYKLYKLEAKD